MKKYLALTFMVVVLVIAIAVPAFAAGAQHYVWDDGIGAYGGPAAAVINKSGGVVWWQVPGTDAWSKDVYKTKAFEGSSSWPVAQLGEPVRTLFMAAFPGVETTYYTREPVLEAPAFPNAVMLP